MIVELSTTIKGIIMNQDNLSTTTLKRQKQARKEVMIERALELFLNSGIESTTMNDVAKASSSGIASAFRYFETKHHLVVATATLLWERLSLEVTHSIPNNFETYTGLEQVAFMLSLFKSFYVDKPDMFRFLEQFDNYVIAHQLSEELLDGYEDKVLWFQPSMMKMIDKGKQDLSIRPDIDTQLLYLTMTHQLMSLIAKLVLRGHVLRSDDLILGEAQLDCVIDMIKAYLKPTHQ